MLPVHLLTLLTLLVLSVTGREKNSGRWDMEITQMAHCEAGSVEKEDWYMNSTKITKIGRNKFTYSTDLIVKRNMTNDIHVYVNFHIFGNGGYKSNFMAFDFDRGCDAIRDNVPDFFAALMKASNRTECPYPPGHYHIKDVPLSQIKSLTSFPMIQSGKYRIKITIVDETEVVIGCMYAYFTITPKKNPKTKKD